MLSYFSYLQARALENKKQWKPALIAYLKMVKNKKQPSANVAYRIGFVAEKSKDWKAAETWLAKAVKGQPGRAQWIYRLALAQEKNKKYTVAIDNYKKALQLSPDKAEWIYRIGFCYGLLKKYTEAISSYKTALKISPDRAEWIYQMGFCYEQIKKYPEAEACYRESLEKNPEEAKWHYSLGKVLRLSGQSVLAEESVRQAMNLEPQGALYAYELALAIRKQGRTWQEVDALQHALSLDAGNAQWHFESGDAQDKMNRFAEAAQAFARANAIQPGNALWYFREGYAWERAGQIPQAKAAYALARKNDKELKAGDFGIGVFHQSRGDWPRAAEAYALEVQNQPGKAELMYRLGMAHDRCYRWRDAGNCYRQAILMNPNQPGWHYRLGFVLERQAVWEQAAKAYEYAATSCATHTPYWFYRLGYVLAQAGLWEEACVAFLKTKQQAELEAVLETVRVDQQTPWSAGYVDDLKENLILDLKERAAGVCSYGDTAANEFHHLGIQAEQLEMWEMAASAYRAAVDRSNSHKIDWYYRLGYTLVQLGRHQEACAAFIETRIINKRPHGVDTSRYEKDAALLQVMEYTEFSETLQVRKNLIVYESFLGNSIGCNPYAIYRAIADDPDFAAFTHVWVVTPEAPLPHDFTSRANTILITRQSQAYRRYLATAEYLLNNVTFPSWFIRRPEQKYLNTWHGTPLKGLGKDMPGELLVHGNVSRNFLHASHLLSPNSHTSDVMVHGYDIAGVFVGRFAETGYPRIDSVLNATQETKRKIKAELGLDETRPIVLYAPTWRGFQGKIETDVEKIIGDLETLVGHDYQLVFRGHHFAEKALEKVALPVTVAGQEFDAGEILAIADVLITDYSSILFDFIPTGRPIIYYAYDLEEYQARRGMYFSIETLPGTLCRDVGETRLAIQAALVAPESYLNDEKYAQAKQAYCAFEDGHATRRAIDFFFRNGEENLVQRYRDEREAILLYNGQFIPNGITSSFLNLMRSLPDDRYRLVVAVDPATIREDEKRQEKILSLPAGVAVLPREGRVLLTPEEAWVENAFMSRRGLKEPAMAAVHHRIYQREFIRLYGVQSRIRDLVNFEGYNGFWSLVFAHGQAERKTLWLHNDMQGECNVRMPHLTRNFSYWSHYRKLVSVSAVMNEINREGLARRYGIDPTSFTYCENVIDVAEIEARAAEVLEEDLQPWFSGTTFLTMGRMSPEKDQEKLLRAFAQARNMLPDAKLVLLGDGPLRSHLENVIEALGLQAAVFLAGQRSNPFPALKACDCFVLPSNHEGQPMVLLEALALGKRIIATDIDGNRGVLAKFGGLLVENSIDGLKDGLENFASETPPVFDAAGYQASAIEHFIGIVSA